jgi:hypothetical protein
MWLPKLPRSGALDTLVEAGIKFTILSPYQASKVRPVGGRAWKCERRETGPFWPAGFACLRRSLALFFYDGPISRAVAFEIC